MPPDYCFTDYGYFGEYNRNVSVFTIDEGADCTEFLSYCYGTPLYRTKEFMNNPYFSEVTTPKKGDVAIWYAWGANGKYDGHAAIYTGEGGGRSYIHSEYKHGVWYSNGPESYYKKNSYLYKLHYYRYRGW
jgi:hypothetical protein